MPIGYAEFPRTWLPARDATASGGIQRSATAPNSSYFVKWNSTEGKIRWQLNVHQAGNYAVELLYTCPLADAGSEILFSATNSQHKATVAPGWDPPLYTNQDTLPRPDGESRLKEFRSLDCGIMHLEAGEQPFSLQATTMPGKSVMDVRALTLTLRP